PQEAPGRATYVARCAGCHGSDGNGGELGPAITTRVPTRTDQDLARVIRDGLPAAGMPAFGSLPASESEDLVRFLRTLRSRTGAITITRTAIRLEDGRMVTGIVLNQSLSDMQLLGDDQKIHLLR